MKLQGTRYPCLPLKATLYKRALQLLLRNCFFFLRTSSDTINVVWYLTSYTCHCVVNSLRMYGKQHSCVVEPTMSTAVVNNST